VDTRKKLKIKYNALNINQMLENLKGAGNRVNLLFLDACRDIPTGTKGGTKGLGQPLEKPIGTLLVYATEAGKVANDNAKFINALIENINKPNQYIKEIGDNISRVVATQSNYKQIPEVFSKLLPKRMVLKGGEIEPKPIVVPSKPVYVVTPVVVKPKTHSTKGITTIGSEMWQDEPINKTKERNWQDAIKYCKNLSLGGYNDWELPSKDRLENLYQNKNKLKNVTSGYYWSSTTNASGTRNAWSVDFYNGNTSHDYKLNSNRVRCVRAGQ